MQGESACFRKQKIISPKYGILFREELCVSEVEDIYTLYKAKLCVGAEFLEVRV